MLSILIWLTMSLLSMSVIIFTPKALNRTGIKQSRTSLWPNDPSRTGVLAVSWSYVLMRRILAWSPAGPLVKVLPPADSLNFSMLNLKHRAKLQNTWAASQQMEQLHHSAGNKFLMFPNHTDIICTPVTSSVPRWRHPYPSDRCTSRCLQYIKFRVLDCSTESRT